MINSTMKFNGWVSHLIILSANCSKTLIHLGMTRWYVATAISFLFYLVFEHVFTEQKYAKVTGNNLYKMKDTQNSLISLLNYKLNGG